MLRYLVTGGAGFIGSHFCHLALEKGWASALLNLDALTYSGNLANLTGIAQHPKYQFLRHDLTSPLPEDLLTQFQPDVIVHFAAESHVDRSIHSPGEFLKTNIWGTYNLLQAALEYRDKKNPNLKFVYISTDEVYGSLSLADPAFSEENKITPRSPYSASKASADHFVSAYHHTYGLQTLTARCSNNYGPRQFPEKLIPQTIIFAMSNRSIPVYGTGENVRDWIFVEDFATGIQAMIEKGRSGDAYNFGGQSELQNIVVVKKILSLLEKPETLIQFVGDRKGHDFRYAMDFSKSTRELDWRPQYQFEKGIAETVNWYRENEKWWKQILSGEYQKFFETYYQQNLKVG